MTEAIYPQCRIVTERFLFPDTVERLLNLIAVVPGVRRIILHGPRIPATVPYGPAKGTINPHPGRKEITVAGQTFMLETQVGTVILELDSREVIPDVRKACEQAFTEFSFSIQEGRFMKTQPSLVDYAKYGPDADEDIIGMADPKSKKGPVILQGGS
jgi:methyl-coenzyme M reductase subunit D